MRYVLTPCHNNQCHKIKELVEYKSLVPGLMTDDDTYVFTNSNETLTLVSLEKMNNWICFNMRFSLYFWSSCWLSLLYLSSWQTNTCFLVRNVPCDFLLQIKSLWHLLLLRFLEFCIAQGIKNLMQKFLISFLYLFISEALDIYCLIPFQ